MNKFMQSKILAIYMAVAIVLAPFYPGCIQPVHAADTPPPPEWEMPQWRLEQLSAFYARAGVLYQGPQTQMIRPRGSDKLDVVAIGMDQQDPGIEVLATLDWFVEDPDRDTWDLKEVPPYNTLEDPITLDMVVGEVSWDGGSSWVIAEIMTQEVDLDEEEQELRDAYLMLHGVPYEGPIFPDTRHNQHEPWILELRTWDLIAECESRRDARTLVRNLIELHESEGEYYAHPPIGCLPQTASPGGPDTGPTPASGGSGDHCEVYNTCLSRCWIEIGIEFALCQGAFIECMRRCTLWTLACLAAGGPDKAIICMAVCRYACLALNMGCVAIVAARLAHCRLGCLEDLQTRHPDDWQRCIIIGPPRANEYLEELGYDTRLTDDARNLFLDLAEGRDAFGSPSAEN